MPRRLPPFCGAQELPCFMHDCSHIQGARTRQYCLAEAGFTVQVLASCQRETRSETSLSGLCFSGLEIRRTPCARRGLPFYFFIFVTGGSKRSLAVNRMWVYIIRGGQIKKNQSHSVRKMTSNFPSPNRSCKLFSGSFTARKRSSDKKDEGADLTLPC